MNRHPKPCSTFARPASQKPPSLRSRVQRTALGFAALLCVASITPLAHGAIVNWTGGGDGVSIGSAANWGGTLPVPNNGDIATFDGRVPGNLVLTYISGISGNFNDVDALTWYLTGTQTGSVTIITPKPNSAYLNIGHIILEPGAGAFTLGDNDPSKLLWLIARPTSAIHLWVNNSTSPATINPRIKWGSQGGAFWTADFSGTGDWHVNNYLNNDNGGDNLIVVNGPGTVYWNPTGFLGVNGIGTPITINGGKLVLQNAHPRIQNQQIGIGTIFEFNAPGAAEMLSGNITGPGELHVSNGTLTLSGQNDYSGGTFLNGGELIVNSAENEGISGPLGVSGLISFNGGTLRYGVNNTYDYSGRFSTAAGQAYRINTAGQNVVFTNSAGLSSSGGTLTKLGAGTLTLAGPSSYSGLTTVSAGKLVFQGPKTGSGNITVADAATLGVFATGSQVMPATLTVGTAAGATLEFDNVSSITTPPIAAGTVTANGAITINVNSGVFSVGQSYPLLSWTSGSAPAVNLGTLIGATGNLTTNGNTIRLNVTALALFWSGATDGIWNTTTANWLLGGGATQYSDPSPVVFDDSATGPTGVTISGMVQPANVTVYNNNAVYSIASSPGNAIGGSGNLIKSGNGSLTLSGGANTYIGSTVINGGVLSVGALANGGAASDIGAAPGGAANLVINGGTLQYTGAGASSDRSFTLGLGQATIDAAGTGPLNLTAPSLGYSGDGPRTLVLAGSTIGNRLAAAITDDGGPTTLTKSGTGSWILTGDNTYSGETLILSGALQVGDNGSSGSLGTGDILNNGSLTFNRSGTVIVPGDISGSGPVTNNGPGTVILAGNNSYTGGTYINAGSTVQIGNGGPSGTLAGTAPIVNNGLLIFDSTGDIIIDQFGGVISGTGNVIVRGTGLVDCSAENTYTGWTLIEPGATFSPFSENHGQLLSSVITNNGTLYFTAQEGDPAVRGYTNNIVGTGKVVKDNNNQNAGWNYLGGDNTYTGGTWIAGGGIQIGDGVTPGRGSIVGPVIFTNTPTSFKNERVLIFDRPDDFVFTNMIISAVTDTPNDVGAQGRVLHRGAGKVTLTGNNSYPGSTTVNMGTLQVGDGGTTGSIGTGPVNLVDITAIFAFNRSDDVTLNNGFTGAGSLVKLGTGKLTLTGNGGYSGTTVVSNGTLVINGNNGASSTFVFGGALGGNGTLSGPVTVDTGGTLAPGDGVGTLTINNNLDIAGNLTIEVNKSLPQPNDTIMVAGFPNNTGSGTLTVVNLGPALAAGDTFTLFNQPLNGGSTLTITGGGPGVTWANNLETDGSITVVTAPPPSPTLDFTRTGDNTLRFEWTGSFKLQAQTNSLSGGLGSQWFDYPGGSVSPVNVTVDPTKGTVFFRLVNTP